MLFEDDRVFSAKEKRAFLATIIVASLLACWGLYEAGAWVVGLF